MGGNKVTMIPIIPTDVHPTQAAHEMIQQAMISESWKILHEYCREGKIHPLDLMEAHAFWVKWRKRTRWLRVIRGWFRRKPQNWCGTFNNR